MGVQKDWAKRDKVIGLLLDGCSETDAAKNAGVNISVVSRWLRQGEFRERMLRKVHPKLLMTFSRVVKEIERRVSDKETREKLSTRDLLEYLSKIGTRVAMLGEKPTGSDAPQMGMTIVVGAADEQKVAQNPAVKRIRGWMSQAKEPEEPEVIEFGVLEVPEGEEEDPGENAD